MIGTTLHHYRIVDRLGAGGMGEVYAAEDATLGRRVALKLLPPEVAGDVERLRRFQREARAIAALNHPNVVTIYSVEEAEGRHFLTMELVEGRTLAEAMPEGGLALEEVFRVARALVGAVAVAHEHGIIHRDLKPANVMLTGDGRVKVLDFGLAKLKRERGEGGETTALVTQAMTGQGVIMGTAAYMSPEQAEGRAVDHRSDLFSLGVVLYELASGVRPFGGDTVFSVISAILKDTPVPLSAVNRWVPAELERVVRRLLEKEPGRRYQSARELERELEAAEAAVASQHAVGRLVRGVVASRGVRRVAAGVGLVGAVVGAAVYGPWGRGGEEAPPAARRATFQRLSAQAGVEQFPSLLPDGKWVVYAGEERGNRDIYLLSTSGQNPINLTADSAADDDEPAVSPDGEWIAFRSSRLGGGLFVMGRTGEGVRRVTREGVAAFNPKWSPDGTELVFATEDVQLTPLNWERKSELWVVNVATGEQRRLDVDDAVQASWSPRGHRIAYVARPWQSGAAGEMGARVMDIWTIPAQGGEPVPLTSDLTPDWSPAWAPDGRHVYFVSDRGGSMNLWRIAVDEVTGRPRGEPEPITTPAPFLAHPSVSADGRAIAYSAVSLTSNIEKMTLDPATATVEGELAWVTTGPRLWANPDPTPDGEWVVFSSRDQPEGDVYVCRPDGTELRQLTSDGLDRVPRWSPDKAWVAFFTSRGGPLAVWKTRFDGSGLQRVTEAGSVPVWSPDGARMATSHAGVPSGRTDLVDPGRSPQAQKPEELPLPEESLRPFIANAWSPDGTMLAGQIGFSDRGGDGVVLYTLESGAYERLTDFGEWPSWLGDSRRLLFVHRGKEFWVVDTRTMETRKIYTTLLDVLGPPRLTRDGRFVFYSRRTTQADIYLLTFQ